MAKYALSKGENCASQQRNRVQEGWKNGIISIAHWRATRQERRKDLYERQRS
jgi:hypothetical protein